MFTNEDRQRPQLSTLQGGRDTVLRAYVARLTILISVRTAMPVGPFDR